MSGSIPQHFIQDLIARVDIVELIQARVHLKKKGRNYSACCPFHDEKTPSFSVSPDKQFYYCFGCGAHGNAVGFLIAYDRMEFLDAIDYLASQVGVEVPKTADQKVPQHPDLYPLMEKVAQFYQQRLRENQKAIDYLKKRGLSGETAKMFSIGFAPENWHNLSAAFNSSLEKNLQLAGMLIEKNQGKPYDRFRHRIMFPIRDLRGRVIAFGGRSLGDELPKYLNSPETPIFHKSNELYGLYEVRQQNSAIQKILITEGYMDVVSLFQHGINYAVATLGTAVNPKHIQKLLRFSNKLVFCFDGDNAGRQAGWKALTMSLPLLRDGIEFQFLFLPDGEDPDSLVQKIGRDNFDAQVKNADSLANVLFNSLRREYNIESLEGKTHFAKQALQYINQMPHGIYHSLLLEKLAEIVQIDVARLTTNSTPEPQIQQPTYQSSLNFTRSMETAIAILLRSPDLALSVEDFSKLAMANVPGKDLLIQLIQIFRKNPTLGVGQLLSQWQNKSEAAKLAELAAKDLMISEEGFHHEFQGALLLFTQQTQTRRIDSLIQKAKQAIITPAEKQELTDLLTDKNAKPLAEE